MMCKLMNIEPENLIGRFLSCLAMERDNLNAEAAKETCIDFFIRSNAAHQFYSEAEIRQMFRELKMINDLWPEDCSSKFLDTHVEWREKYSKYWFKNWKFKARRKKSLRFLAKQAQELKLGYE